MGLGVYLNELCIGELVRSGAGGCEFTYAEELAAGDSPSPDPPPLSLSLPIRPEPYGPEETRGFLDGLLPEGERREAVAEALGLDAGDTYGLLEELGRDCPGAVVFVPEGEEPPGAEEPAPPQLVSEEDLLGFVEEDVPLLPDPEGGARMRFALPGDRPMLALAQSKKGWAWPSANLPSTHLLVTEIGEMPQYVTNMMACNSTLAKIGVPMAAAKLADGRERRCLVIERVDREDKGTAVERVHRETFSQALGIAPDSDEALEAGHASAIELLQRVGADEEEIAAVLAYALVNYVIGNDDSIHGRRAALLHTAEGPTLSPFYPPASEGAYMRPTCKDDERTVGMAVIKAEKQPTIVPDVVGCDPELIGSVGAALTNAAKIREVQRDVAAEARSEGWYRPVVDRIPPYTIPYTFYDALGKFFDLDP